MKHPSKRRRSSNEHLHGAPKLDGNCKRRRKKRDERGDMGMREGEI